MLIEQNVLIKNKAPAERHADEGEAKSRSDGLKEKLNKIVLKTQLAIGFNEE